VLSSLWKAARHNLAFPRLDLRLLSRVLYSLLWKTANPRKNPALLHGTYVL
jgi:hypothetical protein